MCALSKPLHTSMTLIHQIMHMHIFYDLCNQMLKGHRFCLTLKNGNCVDLILWQIICWIHGTCHSLVQPIKGQRTITCDNQVGGRLIICVVAKLSLYILNVYIIVDRIFHP